MPHGQMTRHGTSRLIIFVASCLLPRVHKRTQAKLSGLLRIAARHLNLDKMAGEAEEREREREGEEEMTLPRLVRSSSPKSFLRARRPPSPSFD